MGSQASAAGVGTSIAPAAGAAELATRRRSGVVAWVAENGLLITVVAVLAALWAIAAPSMLEADTWLTLLGGREIVDHGLPREDALAVLTQGRQWVDQQWLAQLVFYGLAEAGGLKLTIIVSILLLVVPLALALGAAARRGASARSAALFAIVPGFYFTSFVRAQILSQLLFVLLLVLLAAESRTPSRRVFLAFPVIALWANLHGAALVGAALVSLLGGYELARLRGSFGRLRWVRPVALLTAPWACLLVTPYGPATIDYYRSTLGNPVFPQALTEWMPPVFPSLNGVAFFVLAGAATVIVARKRAELTGFEVAALAVTLLAALLAVRSITWFAYACLILVAPLVKRERGASQPPSVARVRIACAAASSVFAVVALLLVAARPEESLARHWPAQAAGRVADVVRTDPDARVLASHEFGDWLLFARPELRGRIAFDGRWELLSASEMRSILDYLWQVGEQWERPSRGYRVLVLNPRTEKRLVETYDRRPGTKVLFRSPRVVVYDRGGLKP